MKPPTAGAYLAGIIDGEGSIQARHRIGPKGGYDYVVSVANTDEAMLRWLADNWGGTVSFRRRHVAHHKDQWLWRSYGSSAVAALEAALPFLITKRRQAELVLALVRSSRVTGRAGYSTDEHEAKQALIHELATLNRRGRAV